VTPANAAVGVRRQAVEVQASGDRDVVALGGLEEVLDRHRVSLGLLAADWWQRGLADVSGGCAGVVVLIEATERELEAVLRVGERQVGTDADGLVEALVLLVEAGRLHLEPALVLLGRRALVRQEVVDPGAAAPGLLGQLPVDGVDVPDGPVLGVELCRSVEGLAGPPMQRLPGGSSFVRRRCRLGRGRHDRVIGALAGCQQEQECCGSLHGGRIPPRERRLGSGGSPASTKRAGGSTRLPPASCPGHPGGRCGDSVVRYSLRRKSTRSFSSSARP